jgi:ribosomal RNA assembly protein
MYSKRTEPPPLIELLVDKWKIEPFQPEHNVGGLLEESSFSTLFPKYREQYLRASWPFITKNLEKAGIACTLDLVSSNMYTPSEWY